MSFRVQTLASRGFIAASLAAFSFFGFGCGSDDSATVGAQFTASATPQATRLVKILPKLSSGASVVVQVVLYGPDTTLDLYSFDFDLRIGNTSLLSFVSGSAVAGDALVPFATQKIEVSASPDTSDPSHIEVHVHKSGGGVGNGVAGASAVIVELTFAAASAGSSTLAITASPAPTATDQNGTPIGSITFDSANGTVTGISTGGGPY